MSGFEVEIADMDLLQQVFDRQQAHLDAIKQYVTGNCTTPGGFGIVLQPLAPHYERAYDDGVTGLGNGATVAEACSTKIVETKQALLDTDRKQYERYAQHEAALGHDVPPYTPPAGGGALPPASGGYTEPGEEGKYPSLEDPYKWLASKGYDGAETAARVGHTPEHSAGGPADEPGSDTHEGGEHRADGSDPSGSDTSGSGSSDGGSSGSGSADGGSSGSGSSGSGSDGPQHRAGGGRHEAPDGPNVIDKATDIYNAPGEYIETGQDLAETAETSQDLDEAADGPSNDDQTEWANSGGGSW